MYLELAVTLVAQGYFAMILFLMCPVAQTLDP